jgi:MoaA/NifB/PqqE/SkfB family radical SAM enzyme
MAVFDITNKCNFDCSYCNRKEDKLKSHTTIKEPSLQEILYVYNEIQKNGIYYLAFQGGEPLLRKDIEQVINHISSSKNIETIPIRKMWTDMIIKHNKGHRLKLNSAYIIRNCYLPMTGITTNGSIFNCDLITLLEKFNFYIEVSIDSLNENINKQRRQGVLQRTIIENIINYAKTISSILNVTVGPDNIKSILEIILFAQSCGCIKVVLNPQFSTYSYIVSDQDWKEKYVNTIHSILEYFQIYNLNTLVECIIPKWFFKSEKDALQMQEKANSISNWLFVVYQCQANISLEEIYISPEMNIYPCPHFSQIHSHSLGSLKENTLFDIWNNCVKKSKPQAIEGCWAENIQRIGS